MRFRSSALEGAPGVASLRDWLTLPYERLIGVHQNWTMFVPDAPRSTTWMEATGFRGGIASPVEMPEGAPEPGFKFLYSRAGKFERTAADEKPLRASLVRYLCRRAAEEGAAYDEIQFDRLTVRTPRPADRTAPREQWPVERKRIERWRCEP